MEHYSHVDNKVIREIVNSQSINVPDDTLIKVLRARGEGQFADFIEDNYNPKRINLDNKIERTLETLHLFFKMKLYGLAGYIQQEKLANQTGVNIAIQMLMEPNSSVRYYTVHPGFIRSVQLSEEVKYNIIEDIMNNARWITQRQLTAEFTKESNDTD